jgi:hypothetical protein
MPNRDRLNRKSVTDTACMRIIRNSLARLRSGPPQELRLKPQSGTSFDNLPFLVLLLVHHQAMRSCTMIHNDTA